jgi:hypothetical protein
MERHGVPRKRPRQGGSLLFLIAIGVVVAGAGVAGLHYRNQLWDDHGHPDHVATTPEPTFALPVTLTNADELAPSSSIIVAAPEKEEAKPDAAAPPPPRPTQPVAKPRPVVAKKPPPKPETKEETPSEGEMFSKPD